MNSPTLAAPSPPLADLSLNWVIRRASPKPVRHCSTQAAWACAGTWLWMKIADRCGSMPIASSWAAARRVRSRSAFGSCSTVIACRSAMKKNGAWSSLQVHPLPQRAEVVAEVEGVGGRLDPREHPRPGATRDDVGHADLGLGGGGGGHGWHCP